MRASRFFANPNYADYWSEKIRVKQYEEIYRKEFLQNLQVESKDLVLEVGVGEGRNVLELISKGANYVGIDISGKMLAKTRERIDDQVFDKVDLLVGDALCLPFRQFAFDKVLCFAVVFFLPSQEKAIREILSVGISRVGIEFRNSLNPGVFLYAKASTIITAMQPLFRLLLGSKPLRRVLSIFFGGSRVEGLSRQISLYGSLQPLYPISAETLRNEVEENGWTVEELRSYPSPPQHNVEPPTVTRWTLPKKFLPVLIAHAVRKDRMLLPKPHQQTLEVGLR